MYKVVHCRTAYIHFHLAFFNWFEFLFLRDNVLYNFTTITSPLIKIVVFYIINISIFFFIFFYIFNCLLYYYTLLHNFNNNYKCIFIILIIDTQNIQFKLFSLEKSLSLNSLLKDFLLSNHHRHHFHLLDRHRRLHHHLYHLIVYFLFVLLYKYYFLLNYYLLKQIYLIYYS